MDRQQLWWAANIVVIAVLASGTGCNTIRTLPYSNGSPMTERPNSVGRMVEVEIDPEYFSDRPTCVLLVPIDASTNSASLNSLIEKYFALHLGFRFERVIHGRKRDRSAARLGLDLSRSEDRALLHEHEGCGYEIILQPFQGRSDFALVWARLSLGLEARLTRVLDERLLWNARHTATRSEGGVAISPLSAVSNSIGVAAFISDGDQIVSLVADVTRRVAITLFPAQGGTKRTTDQISLSQSPSPYHRKF